jgi:SAM-dependent methyltransferase
MSNVDKAFVGSIPKIYDEYLVPLIFESYAIETVNRLKSRALFNVLEIAAGTGVVTRLMASHLSSDCSITATDLNQAMLDHAALRGTKRPVTWQQADALNLPFPKDHFDAAVCQFGAMFFPDKAKAYSEARRVLNPGGIFIFSVWDRIEDNEVSNIMTKALETIFPQDPPRFLARTPYGYHDAAKIKQDVTVGGFSKLVKVETISFQTEGPSPEVVAMALCQGTPLRSEIEARDASRLEEATNVCAAAIAKRFGTRSFKSKIQAHIISVEK